MNASILKQDLDWFRDEYIKTPPIFTFSKSEMETPEQDMRSVQSYQ